jgi:Glutamine amidotransferase domain
VCLIIHRPKGGVIPPDYLANGMRRNPDGWGLMWCHRGTIHTVRSMQPNGLVDAIRDAGPGALSVHLRYATHGTKDAENCHPFSLCNGRYALMHNGIIATAPEIEEDRSDTYHFARYVLEPILQAAPKLFDTPGFSALIGHMVGAENKLAILRTDGKTILVNRDQGTECNGLWLSNRYSVDPPIPTFSDGNSWYSRKYTRSPARDADFAEESFDADTDMESKVARLLRAQATAEGNSHPWRREIVVPSDIWDCDGLSHHDLAELCQSDPDTMAEIIEQAVDDLHRAYQ